MSKPAKDGHGSSTQELDLGRGTLLGTLGYLPLEIRLQIYKEVCQLETHYNRLLFKHIEHLERRNRCEWSVYRELDLGHGTLLGALSNHSPDIRLQRCKKIYHEGYLRYNGRHPHVFATYLKTLSSERRLPKFKPWDNARLVHPYITWGNKNKVDIRASPTLKIEYEQFLLGHLDFGFECANALKDFLNQLTPLHLSLLKRLTFIINGSECGHSSCYD